MTIETLNNGDSASSFRNKLNINFTDLDTTKQAVLVSGTNIKTINSQSLLGGGNLNLNDPLSSLPFSVRLVTHRGDNIPFGLYTDTACTTPATADGDSIAAWRDELTGLGVTLIQATSSSRPTLKFLGATPVVRFDGSNDFLMASGSFPLTNRTVGLRYMDRGATEANAGIVSFAVPSGFDFNAPDGALISALEVPLTGFTRHKSCPSIPMFFRYSQVSGTGVIYCNRLLVGTGTSSDQSTGTATRLGIGGRVWEGASAGSPYCAKIDVESFEYGIGFTASQRDLFDAVRSNTGPVIACEGDSLTEGWYAFDNRVSPSLTYPSQLQRMLPNYRVVNFGVYGETISNTVSQATETDRAYYPGAILVVGIGTNDISGGASAATVLADLTAYCQARQAIGWRVFVQTYTSRGDLDAGEEAVRISVNSSIRSGFRAFADGLIDIGLDSRIGPQSTTSDTTYYAADTVHRTAAGHRVVAELTRQAIFNQF